jgi:hypothetical protein
MMEQKQHTFIRKQAQCLNFDLFLGQQHMECDPLLMLGNSNKLLLHQPLGQEGKQLLFYHVLCG